MKLLYSVTVALFFAGMVQAFGSLNDSWPFLVVAVTVGLGANVAFFLGWKMARGILMFLGLVSLSLASTFLMVACIVGSAVGFMTYVLHRMEKRHEFEQEVSALYGHLE